MKRLDDQLHRTLEDIAVGHYKIEYVPGKCIVVADTLSRVSYLWEMPLETEYPVCLEMGEIPQFDRLIVTELAGRPDSLFKCKSVTLWTVDRIGEIRDNVVDVLLAAPTKYGRMGMLWMPEPGRALKSFEMCTLFHLL